MAKSEKLKAEMRAKKARRRACQAADARVLERAAFVAASASRHNQRVEQILAAQAALEAEEEARMAAARAWRATHTAQFLAGQDASWQADTARNARLWGC